MCTISVYMLYVNDETDESPFIDVSVVGHQWYWRYKLLVGCYSGDMLEWDSHLVARSEERGLGFMDLLEVDYPLILPTGVLVRVLVTRDDVIHRWGAPGLGVKVDAIPGRLNRVVFKVVTPSIIYGMCMELCGSLHGLIPTVIEAVHLRKFFLWQVNWDKLNN